MLNASSALLSTESIKHQHSRSLYADLCQAFKSIRDNTEILTTAGELHQAAEAAGLIDLVKERIGIKLRLITDSGAYLQAYVLIPKLDRNHPFYTNGFIRQKARVTDYLRLKKTLDGELTGKIDLYKGTVSGLYSEIESTIFLSPDLLLGPNISVEEVTSAFLHEVGHLVTYYEYLGRSVYLSHVLGDGFLEFFDKSLPRHRAKFLAELQTDLNLTELDEYDRYIDEGNGEMVRTLFVTNYIQRPVSGLNTPYFDMTTAEALADQYVARLGGARAMVTVLDKIHRHHGSIVYKARHKHILVEALRGTMMVAFLPITALLLAKIQPGSPYDTVQDRISRLRRDLVAGTKTPTLTKDERLRIADDIAAIDDVLADIKPNVSATEHLWRLLNPTARKAQREMIRMHEIESLVNNELFRVHNTLKTLES